jgi:hypothetical protein
MFFFRNSVSDQRLLLKVLVLVCFVRLGLWLMPLRILREMLEKIARRRSPSTTRQDTRIVRRIAACVRRVSRYVPAASCLTQALATEFLLARRGQVSSLLIGVTKTEEGEFKAHAWLEADGKIIIGGVKGSRNYTVLHPLKEVRQ